MERNKPNIFNIATKELSQDAFITWLLLFGDEAWEEDYPELNQCSREFITALLRKHHPDFDGIITSVEAKRQHESIDIWVLINQHYRLIIEDKTDTAQHNNQLRRYREIAEKDCHKHNYANPVCIYLKTGNQSAGSLEYVKRDGFHTFLRQDFLKILEKYQQIENDIFQDFLVRLRMLEGKNQAFKDKEIGKWNKYDWQGFFVFLDERELLKNWNYAANAAGGLWWGVLAAHQSVYVQIESKNAKLCFKIRDTNQQSSKAKSYFKYLSEKARESNFSLHKPKRFGSGKTMTAAVIACEDWLGNKEDKLNPEDVVLRLRKVIAFFEQTAQQFSE